MKNLVGSAFGLVLIGLTTPVCAADLSASLSPLMAPIPVAKWSGPYIGINGGVASGRTSIDFLAQGTHAPHSPVGGFGGGTLGFDYQRGNYVVGVLGDADGAGFRGSTTCPGPAFTCASQSSFLGSVRARLGYVFGPALIYATGGLGLGEFQYRTIRTATGLDFGSPNNISKAGYTVGAGIEIPIDPHLSIKTEYVYYGFDTNQAPAGMLGAGPVNVRTNVHTVKLGLDYRFDTPRSALVAKY